MRTPSLLPSVRVGIVDDHAIFRDGLRSLLGNLADPLVQVVFECDDGLQVTRCLSSQEADLVLMDVQMPVLDGIRATATIHSSFPGTKVIALSSFSSIAPVLEMVSAGARGYLLKNVNPEELSLAIREVMANRLYFTPQVSSVLNGGVDETSPEADNALSAREVEILRLVCRGMTSQGIGDALFISRRTVDGHRDRIMQKTNCRNLIDLFLFAIRNDLYRPG